MAFINVIDLIFNIYFSILIVYIFATWIPNVDWRSSPWKYLYFIANIYLGIFEALFSSFGAIVGLKIGRASCRERV